MWSCEMQKHVISHDIACCQLKQTKKICFAKVLHSFLQVANQFSDPDKKALANSQSITPVDNSNVDNNAGMFCSMLTIFHRKCAYSTR